MARPFRLQAPSLPERAVPRPRLLQRLAARWERRLVTLVAGPGFGKTVLLAGAVGDRQERAPARRDVWLTCEPADESAEHLLGGLTAALGATSGTSLEDLCDGVWSAAPLSICFILDDVHEIPPRSAGAAVLRNLLVELPANGHVVLASRDPVPVPLSRLAASGQLDRLTEGDLVLDPSELAAFAVARDVDPALLASTGGWPALAELTVTAGEDLVLDYLWEEVLGRVGDERTRLLAAFSIVGGGDDEIVTALAGRPYRADDLIADVPLVARTHEGWATLHPLWRPALRAILSEQETTHVQQRAAAVHLERGRHSMAIDVLADAGDWDGVLAVVRAAALEPGALLPSSEFGRWVRLLPREWRGRPEAELAAGIDRRARSPLDALPSFEAAACGFRARGDVDGEVAAIGHDGAVRWTANDFGGVLALYQRVQELAVAEVRSAQELAAVGQAAMAHIGADSAGVLDALRGVGDSMTTGWLPVVHWFRSVAHRRMGHLQRAYDELDAAHLLPDTELDMRLQLEVARLRTDWLAGRVEHVFDALPAIHAHFVDSGDRFLATEAALELAAKAGFLGEVEAGRRLLDSIEPVMADMPGPLARILKAITAVIAVASGDEARAAALVHDDVLVALGRPEGWYWRDRAAIALSYVLVPESRDRWLHEPLGAPHRAGLELGRALAAVRDGDFSIAADLEWPATGVVRAHLPVPWIVELAAAGRDAKNPPPADLVVALGPRLHPAVRSLAGARDGRVAAAAAAWLAEIPQVPAYHLRIDVLGPLRVTRDGEAVTHPALGRQRVRQLLSYLVARRRVRRETVAEELWPDAADAGQNLRVTLTHLQQVLQPERPRGDPPYFLRTEGQWLILDAADRLAVDAWELDTHLDAAERADSGSEPERALTGFRAALAQWRGDPYGDVPYDEWTEPERARLRARYTAAAVRAAELLLAAGSPDDAATAAEAAITADSSNEQAYGVVARARLAQGDHVAARRALDRCALALSALELEPDPATFAMLR